MTLTEIIARLEAATGPDRELDAAIDDAVRPEGHTFWCAEELPVHDVLPSGIAVVIRHELQCGRYTASVDAALTLVPEGWHWTVYDTDGTEKSFAAIQIEPPSYSSAPFCGSASIPAIALCIASLKARSAP